MHKFAFDNSGKTITILPHITIFNMLSNPLETLESGQLHTKHFNQQKYMEMLQDDNESILLSPTN